MVTGSASWYILQVPQVDPSTPGTMKVLITPLVVVTFSNITFTYKYWACNRRVICQALLHSNKPEDETHQHTCRQVNIIIMRKSWTLNCTISCNSQCWRWNHLFHINFVNIYYKLQVKFWFHMLFAWRWYQSTMTQCTIFRTIISKVQSC